MKNKTSPCHSDRLPHFTACLCPLFALLLIVPGACALTFSWTGSSGVSGNWSDFQNWGFVGVPSDGDTLIFPGGVSRLTNTNDISSLTVAEVRFVGVSGGYDIYGNAFTLTNGIAATNSAGANTLNNSITLDGTNQTLNVGSGAALTLSGALDGTAGVTKPGTGTLTYAGAINNNYAGPTIVVEGTLELAKFGVDGAIPNTLQVGDEMHSATVRWLSYNQIPNIGAVTVHVGSVLDVNNWWDDLGSLTLYGGTVNMGTGYLDFRPPHSITKLPGTTATLNGHIGLPSGDINVDVQEEGTLALEVPATVTGSHGFTKTGPGGMRLQSANSYQGLTVVAAGRLWLSDGQALGATLNGTVVSNLASLVIDAAIGITNEALTLNGYGTSSGWGALDLEASGSSYWAGPITLGAESTILAYSGGAGLHIDGPIDGSGGLIIGTESGDTGSGTVYFDGSAANTYGGDTSVRSGTLVLNKSAFDVAVPHNLSIGYSAGPDTVRLLQQNQIPNAALVTVNNSALFDLNGNSEGIDSLDMTAGTVNTGAGTLVLFGTSITTHAATSSSVLTGSLSLFGGQTTFEVANDTPNPDLLVSADISGQGLLKTGAGNLRLSGANTYTGATTISSGFIIIDQATGLGSAAAGTTLAGGKLSLAGAMVVGETLTVDAADSILQAGGTSGWGSDIVLNASLRIQTLAGGTFDVSGPISGTGDVTKDVSGTLRFSGSQANTYTGVTTVLEGLLELGKSSFTPAIPGALVIGDGSGGVNADVVQMLASGQTTNSCDVTITASGLLDYGAFYSYIDELGGDGNIAFDEFGYLIIGTRDGSSTFNGVASGIGYPSGYTVRKVGAGTITFNGDNTYLNETRADAGTLVINGSQPQSPLILSGGTAGGHGTVGNLGGYAGTLAPGVSPGILTCSNTVFTSAADYHVELTGPTPGSDYDQLLVRGTNDLGDATLTVDADFTTPVAAGQEFRIIDNDGFEPITGTFSGLAEGASITAGFYTFTLSYVGGTGNDVVLTLTEVPAATVGGLSGISAGNGNGSIDPDECNHVSVVLTNTTAVPMTGVSATLASVTQGVIVTELLAPYADAPANGTATNVVPFQLSTTPDFECGSDISLELTVDTASHGSFTVPVLLSGFSGLPASIPSQYDIGVSANIPDIGFLESTNTVAGYTGPLTKVAVSVWVTHVFDGDLNLSLISPDGVVVDLSSGNGGAGVNYGTGCSPETNRTTFDDDAAAAITAGSAPFVGTYRPEDSLATVLGGTINGDWRLRVEDTGGGTLGALRCWSLMLYGAECTPGSGLCELCPNVTLTTAIGANSPLQPGYVLPDGTNSTCGVARPCPGAVGGNFPSANVFFRNGPAEACITVTVEEPIQSGYGMVATAYTGDFDPMTTNLCDHYLASAADVIWFEIPQSFSFDAAANEEFVINLVAGGPTPYRLTVTGGDCRPVLNIAEASTGRVVLDWTTAAPGYQLESTNGLPSGGPIWSAVTGEPIVIDSRYSVTNDIPSGAQYYRLRKATP